MPPGPCKTRSTEVGSAGSVAGWSSICTGSNCATAIYGSSTRTDDGD